MKKSFFPNGLRPMSINSGAMFMVSVGFPNQRQRYSTSSVTWDTEVTNKSYAMRFQVTGMDVIQARNKKSRPCDEEWRKYDEKAKSNRIASVGCVPPYWKSQYPDENLQICNDSNSMKKIYVDSEWNHHTHPCRRMARFTTSYWEYPTTLHDNDVGPKYKDKYFSLHFLGKSTHLRGRF